VEASRGSSPPCTAVCPEIEARKVLTENLADEEIHGADHPELWLRFAEGLGADSRQSASGGRLPETEAMVSDFFALTSGEWTQGLCALFAYESQVPAVSASKMDGLRKFYGIEDARTLGFSRPISSTTWSTRAKSPS